MPRSVLVTGATSGIGLATVLHLSRLGFHTIGSARTDAKAQELARRTVDAGADVDVVVLDLNDLEAGRDIVANLGLWALVNNAGYMNVGAVEDVPVASAREQFEAMVMAPVRLAQLVLPGMRAAGEGRIVNISSITSRTTGPMIGWYQAAKHAVSALTDALRTEVDDFGVDVVVIEPGGHRSGIWRRAELDLLARRETSLYRTAYDRSLSILGALEPRMPPAGQVAEVIGDVLTAGHPRSRYRVGADAAALEILERLVPTSLKDRALRAVLGL